MVFWFILALSGFGHACVQVREKEETEKRRDGKRGECVFIYEYGIFSLQSILDKPMHKSAFYVVTKLKELDLPVAPPRPVLTESTATSRMKPVCSGRTKRYRQTPTNCTYVTIT
jgi:hypothetical protein